MKSTFGVETMLLPGIQDMAMLKSTVPPLPSATQLALVPAKYVPLRAMVKVEEPMIVSTSVHYALGTATCTARPLTITELP